MKEKIVLSRGLFNLLRLQSAKPTSKGLESILKNIPKESAQKTQLGKSTIPTYKKVEREFLPEGKRLDYGAGRGLGAKEIKAELLNLFHEKILNLHSHKQKKYQVHLMKIFQV